MYITLNSCILLGEAAMHFRSYAVKETAQERRRESSVVTQRRKVSDTFTMNISDSHMESASGR